MPSSRFRVHRSDLLAAPLAAVACALAAACAPAPPEGAGNLVETVPLHVLARTIADRRGQVVRVCGGNWGGTVESAAGQMRGWVLVAPDPSAPATLRAFVNVRSCDGRRPRRSGDCITGRIAREDGSLTRPESIMVGSHQVGRQEWWVHSQCAAQHR